MKRTSATIQMVLICLFSASCLLSFAEESKTQLDRNYWRHLKDGLRYDESTTGDKYNRNWADKFDKNKKVKRDENGGFGKYSKQKKSGRGNELGNYPEGNRPDQIDQRYLEEEQIETPDVLPEIRTPSWTGFNMAPLFWIILIVVVIIFLFLLYKLIINSQSKKDKAIKVKAEEEQETVEVLEQIELSKSELEIKLEAAITKGNYREAIRIWFIFIIKGLRENGWIAWEKKKTNYSYLRELTNRKQYAAFSQSITYFELIWYGKYDLNKNEYQQLEPLFRSLNKSVEQKEN